MNFFIRNFLIPFFIDLPFHFCPLQESYRKEGVGLILLTADRRSVWAGFTFVEYTLTIITSLNNLMTEHAGNEMI